MKKLFILALFIFVALMSAEASQITTNYNLSIPARASRDWLPEISSDIISLDAFTYIISQDVQIISDEIGLLTDDTTGTVGGIVGRTRWVSEDGTVSYMLLYSDS